jgi:hypothetical protein
MRDVKSDARKGQAGAVPASKGSGKAAAQYTITVDRATHDLLEFLSGQKSTEDAPMAYMGIKDLVDTVLNDELLRCLREWEETYVYWNKVDVDGQCHQANYAGRDLINLLDRYQKARLRAALERMNVPGLS